MAAELIETIIIYNLITFQHSRKSFFAIIFVSSHPPSNNIRSINQPTVGIELVCVHFPRSEVPPPVESAHQRHKSLSKVTWFPGSKNLPSLAERDLYCSLLVPLIDNSLQGILVIILIELNSMR